MTRRSDMESATLPGAICTCAQGVPIDLKFAFQPIVDTRDRSVFAQEALVRGPQGQGAGEILARVRDINIHAFDRTCRVGAVKTAVRIFGHRTELLSLNMMPNAVYDPETCLRTTVAAAETAGFAASRLMFEMTEHEAIRDLDHFKTIVAFYKRMGFITAIDDFGAGSSGLTLFASIRPDIVKLDRKLVAGIDRADIQKAIVGNLVDLCAKLDIGIVAEGVEEAAEVAVLQDLGVNFFQGYFFARPAFEAIVPDADIVWA